MDDVIAVEVMLDSGETRYFITWGRIQDEIDPQPVNDLVLRHSRSFALGGQPVSARVCGTMQVAARAESAPYFYECLLRFAGPVPRGDGYRSWRDARAAAMESGREIAYCGSPGPGLG